MARKRKIRSDLRGTSKKMKTSSSRRLGSRKRRSVGLKPEVKYTVRTTTFAGVWFRDANTSTLNSADYSELNSFPAAGTSDNQRIGDTILGKKLYIRMAFTSRTDSAFVRVIIFNMRVVQSSTNAIAGFWQTEVGRPTVYGIINREIVNKVFYDKVKPFQNNLTTTTAASPRCLFFKNLNISMKWPVIFKSGTSDPKDPRNQLFIACIMSSPTGSADTISMGRLDVTCNMYYSDP